MGSLLLPLLISVTRKAGDALVGELLRAWGLDADRRRLERHLSAAQSILLDAEAKSRTSPAVREWVQDLKTAAYDAGDALDDFRYEALRRKAQIRGSTTRKVLSYLTVNSPIVFRFSMSRKLKNILQKIDELVVEMNNFHFLENTETPSIDHPQTHSHVDESEIVGKQDEKEEVVKILLDQPDNNSVKVLPIVGMGGIGKTTLVQLVYNDGRVKRHFELLIWVCVSENFVLADLIRSIIEVATMKKCDVPNKLESLQMKLGKVLGKKRYLLVFDDVWNEDAQKWDGLRSLLCSHAGSGSAIIVTSRSSRVASIMGTVDAYQISPLNGDLAWELFHRKAFQRGVEEQPETISIAKKIVKKCNGLPLAINTMAALLSSKHPSEWSSVLDGDAWTSDSNGIRIALKLSYDHLSSEAKRCFSFCAVFSKDSLIEKDMLVQLWIANDFVESETRGQQIFDELVCRCFLQVVEPQEFMCFDLPGWFFCIPTTYRVHDLMHDLAESTRGNDCLILQESSHQKILQGSTHASSLLHVRHLSVDSLDDSAVMKKIRAPHTIFFLQWQWGMTTLSMAKPEFTSLRALKLKAMDFHTIRRCVTHLKHLRYLDLSYSNMVVLPEATAMLYSLQTLKLVGCYRLEKLPEGMRYMTNLRHVFLVRCDKLKRMPPGIGQLNCLQTLTNYVTDNEVGRGLDELKLLSLSGALHLSELRKVQSAENAKQGNISSKHNLIRLSLDWGNIDIGDEACNAEEILEALRPPKTLQVLAITHYTGAKFSLWMQNFALLEHVCELWLSRCKNCKDLPPLWELPSLRYLHLDCMDNLTSICRIGNDSGKGESCISPPTFAKLENMYVLDMPKLERWHLEVEGQVALVSFPQLKKLQIIECPMLASMPKLPLLEDLVVMMAERLPLYHLFGLSVQSNLGWRDPILVTSAGLHPTEYLHLSSLCDPHVPLELTGLTENVEHTEEELNILPRRLIKKLYIKDCSCLFSSELAQIPLRNIWNHFAFVEDLKIARCSDIVQWPAGEFRTLNCLRSLELRECPNLAGSFPTSDDQGVLLPQLKVLEIECCGDLVDIPNLPASLEILHVRSCRKLVHLPTNLGNLTKLRELCVYGCDSLPGFPDGMDDLTALKNLSIDLCPGVETLPEGLLHHLPTLQQLSVRGCPNLVMHCSRGGAYWDLVKAIPDARIGGRTKISCT